MEQFELIWFDLNYFDQLWHLIWFDLDSKFLLTKFDLIWNFVKIVRFDLTWFEHWNHDLNTPTAGRSSSTCMQDFKLLAYMVISHVARYIGELSLQVYNQVLFPDPVLKWFSNFRCPLLCKRRLCKSRWI